MNSVQLTTVSTVDAICRALEHDIFSLHFAPGEKITEQELVERYHVSRNTLREAITQLRVQGLLTKEANKGVSVKKLSVEDVKEIFHLRALLEQEAVRRILANGNIPAHLGEHVEAMEGSGQPVSLEDKMRSDFLFHSGLVAASGSTRLQKLYDTIQTEGKLCIYQTSRYVPFSGDNPVSHRLILETLQKGDCETTQRLIEQHIFHVIEPYCAGVAAWE